MSGRRAKAQRKAAGNPPKGRKVPTPLLDRAYIQAPVAYDGTKAQYRYRSPGQVRSFLEARGVDTEALAAELEALMAEVTAAEEEDVDSK